MKTPRAEDLGRVARQRRLDMGLSQDDLADRAGVTRQWLFRFETAKSDVSLQKTLRVLQELELAIDVGARAAPSPSVQDGVVLSRGGGGIDEAVLNTMSANLRKALSHSSMSESTRAALEAISVNPAMTDTMRKLNASNRARLTKVNLAVGRAPEADESAAEQ